MPPDTSESDAGVHVDVRLSSEQVALGESVRRAVADHGPGAVGDLDDAARRAALDSVVTSAGWRELRTPDEAGKPWASGVEVAIVAEEMARGPADASLLGPTLAAELRRLSGAPGANEAETVLLSPDLSRIATSDRGAIAVDAHGATTALWVTPSEQGWALTCSPISETATTVDLTRPTASAAGPATPVEGADALDDDTVRRVQVLGTAITCADLVGAMEGTTRLAVDYVRERHQYGKPVGSFQAVQHMLADAHVSTEGSRSATLHAAWAVDALDVDEALVAVGVAKAYAGRAARDVCETSIQAHGGIGNTWECMAHVFLRRALLSTDMFGGVDASLGRVLAGHGIEEV